MALIQEDRYFQCRYLFLRFLSLVVFKGTFSLPLRQTCLIYPSPSQPRCDLCSLSGEALKKDESIRFQIRELSAAIENEGDTVEVLRKAEVKLDLMEKLENRLTLRFPHHLLTCYTLARQLEDTEKASAFKERILTLAKILGHYYHNYFLDLLS